MTDAVVAQTAKTGRSAGDELAETVMSGLRGDRPDALVVFATPDQDHTALLEALSERCRPGVLVGCSSAGEFTSDEQGVGRTCLLALKAPGMKFTGSIASGLRADRAGAAERLVAGFRGGAEPHHPHRAALVLTDALAGYADDLVDRLAVLTGGIYRFFGGGAGDDARFERTQVFLGTQVATDAVVALEILSSKPIGVGVRHGWEPVGDRMRVTEAEGMRLGSLNGAPAAELFEAHASSTGQPFDRAEPVPFFLHNVLGVESSDGYRLRVPLEVEADGSIACAADVPSGSISCIMSTTPVSAAAAAAEATRSALAQMDGGEPAVALVFDCVATRLRLGQAFTAELEAVRRELGDVEFVGFNTYGQIAQVGGQFSGFHNCTAVICVFPR